MATLASRSSSAAAAGLFPPGSSYHDFPKSIQAAVLELVMDMHAAKDASGADSGGTGGGVEMGRPMLRTAFATAAAFAATATVYVALAVPALVSSASLAWSAAADGGDDNEGGGRHHWRRRRCVRTHALQLSLLCWFQTALVLPLSFFVLLVHNWVLGGFFCYTLTMLQVSYRFNAGHALATGGRMCISCSVRRTQAFSLVGTKYFISI